MLTIKDVSLAKKRVVIREDFNVPIIQGEITSLARIEAALPTLQYALSKQAIVTVISHLGRPQVGQFDPPVFTTTCCEAIKSVASRAGHFG